MSVIKDLPQYHLIKEDAIVMVDPRAASPTVRLFSLEEERIIQAISRFDGISTFDLLSVQHRLGLLPGASFEKLVPVIDKLIRDNFVLMHTVAKSYGLDYAFLTLHPCLRGYSYRYCEGSPFCRSIYCKHGVSIRKRLLAQCWIFRILDQGISAGQYFTPYYRHLNDAFMESTAGILCADGVLLYENLSSEENWEEKLRLRLEKYDEYYSSNQRPVLLFIGVPEEALIPAVRKVVCESKCSLYTVYFASESLSGGFADALYAFDSQDNPIRLSIA